MADNPNFATAPRYRSARIQTANANRDGTGDIVEILVAGASGSRIENIRVNAIAATTPGMVRLYVHDGTNARLIKELEVTAATPSDTVKVWSDQVGFQHPGDWLMLPAGHSIRASTAKAEAFDVHVIGSDF